MDLQRSFVLKVLWVCFINCLLIEQTLAECSCKIGDLEELEKLNRDLKRIRVEKSNKVEKYLPNELNSDSSVNCDSLVLYEIINDGFKGAILKKCRVCTSKGWSDIELCQLPKCDRDNLVGQPKVQLAYSQMASPSQKRHGSLRGSPTFPESRRIRLQQKKKGAFAAIDVEQKRTPWDSRRKWRSRHWECS